MTWEWEHALEYLNAVIYIFYHCPNYSIVLVLITRLYYSDENESAFSYRAAFGQVMLFGNSSNMGTSFFLCKDGWSWIALLMTTYHLSRLFSIGKNYASCQCLRNHKRSSHMVLTISCSSNVIIYFLEYKPYKWILFRMSFFFFFLHSDYSLIGLALRNFLQNNKNSNSNLLLICFFFFVVVLFFFFFLLPHTIQSFKFLLKVDLTGKLIPFSFLFFVFF